VHDYVSPNNTDTSVAALRVAHIGALKRQRLKRRVASIKRAPPKWHGSRKIGIQRKAPVD
jgi:hypothetical protein